MKKRKIHRPGVPAISAQNEQGEDEGIGVNAPVPFVFPRNEPKRVKALATWDFSHVLACSGTRRGKQQPDAAKNKLTRRGRVGCRFASFRMLFEIFHWN